VKINALEILDKQLSSRAKKGQYGIIVLSSATDPYLHLEEKYQLTRQALEIILKYKFPVHMITKSTLIERDFDLLTAIDKEAILPEDLSPTLSRGCIISFSFSTLDDQVGKHFEPGAPLPSNRLETVQKAVDHGFLTGISLMPLLPFISDTTAHLEQLFQNFQAKKVDYVLPATLTLFGEGKADSKTLVMQVIRKHYPHLEARYLKYFAHGAGMPDYYRKAFAKKMQELSTSYRIPASILEGAKRK